MIPFVSLNREFERIEDEVSNAIRSVLESQWFVLGEEVNRFERRFANYLGGNHCVSMNSGSDALLIALEALDVGDGDEVVLPAHTFTSTANAVVQAGAKPVFVDVNPETYCIDVEAFRAAVGDDTAAVIPVHLYGHPAELNSILDVASEEGIYVVEDACQAHGATYKGEAVGTLGDIGCFSFYPTKNLGAYGDGGAAVTDDPDIAERMAQLRNVGQAEKYQHVSVGYNSRLDELQAAILNVKLDYLDTWNDQRREIAAAYDDSLNGVVTPVERTDATHVYHLYVVRTDRRDELREYLDDQGVGTLIHYPTPIHQQPAYSDYADTTLPVTEQITAEIVSLPMHPWVEPTEVETVINHIESFCDQ